MNSLWNFIVKYSTWFIFIIYVLISCILIVNNNAYQQSIYLTSANKFSAGVYSSAEEVTGYFALRDINRGLQASNARLENEVLNLRQQLAALRTLAGDSVDAATRSRYSYILATVINNTTRHPRNYFTIDKGEKDGVQRGMGVVNHQGIVGIVNVVGPNTARVISLLNETQHFSVRLKKTPFVGSLIWNGQDPNVAYMEEVPRHAQYQLGDTIVTSGYSTTFPEGLDVGTVMGRVKSSEDNYYTLKVRLLPNFRTLGAVRVIRDIYKAELDTLAAHDIKIAD